MKRKGKIPGRYHKTLKEQVRENPRPVSYTHLTLPTILRV